MSVIAFPDGLHVARMSWAQQRMDMEFRSIFGAQATEGGVPLWAVSLEIDRKKESDTGTFKALLMQLRGRVNQLSLWDVARPTPLGTMRGALTLGVDAVQGATSLNIAAGVGQALTTLLAGDWLGIGSGLTQQLVMVATDAAADAAGDIVVSIEPPLRNAFLIGESVRWDKPKALFRRQNSKAGWDYESVFASGFALDLIEDWRP